MHIANYHLHVTSCESIKCVCVLQYDGVCSCQAWKPGSNSQDGNFLPSLLDTCRNCQHQLDCHVRLVKDLTDDQLDKVLLIVYDMDNILLQMRNEKEDNDLRKTYGFLFNFLRKNMLQPKLPSIAGDKLGTPPFEKVSIAKVCSKGICCTQCT